MAKPRKGTIFCIGTDPLRLNLRCAFLKANGWRVLSAGSGHEGIIRCSQESFDAVILDMNDNGAEAALVAGELKRLRPKLPVVMLLSDDSPLAPDATKQADAVVTEPTDGQELLRALKAVVP
jgi:two-component system, NtrC family, response regulator GlrR